MYKTVSPLDTEGRNEWNVVSVLTKDSVYLHAAWVACGRSRGIPSRLRALYRRRVLAREAIAMARLRAIDKIRQSYPTLTM